MAAGRQDAFDPESVAGLARMAERFAAEGQWGYAIETARSVQRQYEELAVADPDTFAGLAAKACERVERMVAEASSVGAPTTLEPSAAVRAMVDAVSADGSESEPSPAEALNPIGAAKLAEGRVLATALDDLAGIPSRKLHRADDSVREAVERARRAPSGTAAEVAEKLARHAVILRRFDRHADAHDAALLAAQLYSAVGEDLRQPRDDGFFAYGTLLLAIGWFAGREADAAYAMAGQTVALFKRHRRLLTPANMFDLAQALGLLAECQAEGGEMDQARQSVVDARLIADSMHRAVPGEPGSMPRATWGLPVVPSHQERKALYG